MKRCLEGLEGQVERFRLNRRDESQGRRQQCESHNRGKDGAEQQRVLEEHRPVPPTVTSRSLLMKKWFLYL